MEPIHKIVLARIAAAAALSSLLAGGAGFTIEVVKLDRLAERVALAEARRLVPALSQQGGAGLAGGEWPSGFMDRLLQEHCLLVRVYDPQGILRFESMRARPDGAGPDLQARLLARTPEASRRIQRFDLEGRQWVQFHVPLPGPDGRRQGTLEAIYLLDPQAVQYLKANVQRLTLVSLLTVLATALIIYPILLHLNRRVVRYADSALTGNLEVASVIGAAIAQRDSNTGSHNYRVTLYAFRLAETLGMKAVDLRVLLLGAFLHDIGKIGIGDGILLKPGPLSGEEMAIMRTHVARGLAIIGSAGWLQLARPVIACHHERFDGEGYPQGLAGEAIPMEARIFAIVDGFDAMTSERPYKQPMPLEEALARLRRDAGSHFDSRLVAAFCQIAPEAYREIHAAGESSLRSQLVTLVERHRGALHEPMTGPAS